MSPRILIITDSDDVHAIAVAEALRARGVEPTVWATADFPTREEETLRFDDKLKSSVKIRGVDIDLHDFSFDVVWRRRPSFLLDRSLIHPADFAFASGECSIFRTSLINLLAPDAFWVNPPKRAAAAGSKMLQHRAAARVGLTMPETLYTNSPGEVRAFIRDKKGRVIYKPFLPTGWTNGSQQFMPYTALLEDESLVNETLRFTPGIFQELIPKAYEVRLTMIGRRAFAAKVHSQDTVAGRLDWRRAYSELRFEALELPPHIEEQCASLLENLGLVFGCLDLIVTPEGEHIFLEVNEMGQFLFVERYSNLPLLDAFVNFLIQGRSDFEWSADDVSIRYSDRQFEALVNERTISFSRAHVSLPARLIDEAS